MTSGSLKANYNVTVQALMENEEVFPDIGSIEPVPALYLNRSDPLLSAEHISNQDFIYCKMFILGLKCKIF